MKKTKIYQTLKDSGDPDWIEANGPFSCNWKNAWLGDGFYFWEYFIENAHWWGKVHCNNCYMICQAFVDLDDKNCFDLVGNTSHLDDFGNTINLMKEKGILNKKTTVSRVLKFMQNENLFLNYSSIRAFGINSKSKDFNPNYRLIFEIDKKYQYLQYKPEIQLCVIKLKDLNFRDFTVVYPDIYNPEYAV